MAKQLFKAGDGVEWLCYGAPKRGTVVETPNGSVVIIREHDTWRRTWVHIDSLRLANA